VGDFQRQGTCRLLMSRGPEEMPRAARQLVHLGFFYAETNAETQSVSLRVRT